jgi:type IV secretion system protein VirD4
MRRFLNNLLMSAEANTQRIFLLCMLALWTTVAIVGFVLSPPIGVIIFVLVLAINARKSGNSSTTHGSASFAEFSDLWRAGCLFQRSGVLLGKTIALSPPSLSFVVHALLTYPLKRSAEAVAIARLRNKNPTPLAIRVPDRIPHLAVFSPSGGGKSTCFAFPQLFDCPDSTVVLDSKGELCRGTARFRHDVFGSEIVILDPYGVTEGCGFRRARFNPLDLFLGDENRIVDESRRVANSLIVRTGKETDQFWPESSCVVITAILSFLAAMARPEEANLNRMRDILSSPELVDQMLNVMMQSDKCGGLLRRLAGQVMQFQGQTKASVFSVANSHAGMLDSLALAETLSESTFDPRAMLERRMTIYICLPVDRRTELAGIQRVFVSSLINMVFAGGENPRRRVRFLLDEAATLGAMDSLYNAVQFGRSFGLRMMFLFQSTSQVERCFPESQKDDFFATTGCVYASTSDYRTAKDVSDWIGQATVLSRSDQNGRNWGGSRTNDGANPSSTSNWGGNSSTSYNEVARPLLRPEEVLQLPTNLAIVLLPNVRPIFVLKVPYFTVTGRRKGRQLLNILRGAIAITLTVALFAVVGWALTSGANDPRVIHFWEGCRQVLKTR